MLKSSRAIRQNIITGNIENINDHHLIPSSLSAALPGLRLFRSAAFPFAKASISDFTKATISDFAKATISDIRISDIR